MSKTGPKSLLERKDVVNNIKSSILSGNNLRETALYVFDLLDEFKDLDGEKRAEEMANFIQKIYNWNCDNYLDIADKIEGWKRDRKLMLAEKNIEDILGLGAFDKDSLKTVADMSKFVAETLNKKYYSKRTEQTGADGKDLPTPILGNVYTNNSDKKDNTTEQEN